jgi:predicted XRE-type DNA-binding protein
MTEPLDVIRGSGNLFRDLGMPNPDLEQFRCILAARIIKILDQRKLTVRAAQELTGIAAADFSRLRRARLDRFTIDRLIIILGKLDQEVELKVKVRPIKRPVAQTRVA